MTRFFNKHIIIPQEEYKHTIIPQEEYKHTVTLRTSLCTW